MTLNRIYLLIILVLLLIIGYNKLINHKPNGSIPINVPILDENDTASAFIDTGSSTVTVQEKQKDGHIETTHTFVPAESNVSVTVSTQTGKTTVDYNTKGFTFKPIINYNLVYNIGIGCRFFYWNEFGAIATANYNIDSHIPNLNIGIDYRLYKLRMKNVSISVSYSTENRVNFGINLYLN